MAGGASSAALTGGGEASRSVPSGAGSGAVGAQGARSQLEETAGTKRASGDKIVVRDATLRLLRRRCTGRALTHGGIRRYRDGDDRRDDARKQQQEQPRPRSRTFAVYVSRSHVSVLHDGLTAIRACVSFGHETSVVATDLSSLACPPRRRSGRGRPVEDRRTGKCVRPVSRRVLRAVRRRQLDVGIHESDPCYEDRAGRAVVRSGRGRWTGRGHSRSASRHPLCAWPLAS